MPTITRRPLTRRRAIVTTVVAIAGFALVYGLVVALYAGSAPVQSEQPTEPDPNAVQVVLEARDVNAETNRLTVDIELGAGGLLAQEDALDGIDTVHLLVSGAASERSLVFRLDEITPRYSVEIILVGEVEQWPLDVHAGQTAIVAYVEGDDERILDTQIHAIGDVPGWRLSATTDAVEDDDFVVGAITFEATRSGATLAFGIVLLGLMVIMPVLVLTVAITTLRGRRKVNADLMGWMAAMLFATIPLRGFLPGAPPIGSWIDFLIVLWVFVGLITGLVLYVIAWLRWSPVLDRQ